MLVKAKNAAKFAARLDTKTKNDAIRVMAKRLVCDFEEILSANALDMREAEGRLSPVMLDRLMLNEKRIKDMADGMMSVADLPDPVNAVLSDTMRPNGLIIQKRTCPIGVIAIIYESRPNVTSDAAVLCFKSSNVCVLKPGRDSYRTAKAITDSLCRGLEEAGLPSELINLVPTPEREAAAEIMKANGLVDLLIPRGGAGLIRACVENASVPCIETGTGICHIYVEKSADQDTALDIIDNAKTSRPSVCNAAEVLLVDRQIAHEFLPKLKKRLVDDRAEAGLVPVQLRLDGYASGIIDGIPASDNDFDTEFLDYILAVKTVSGIDEAIEHIALHSTHHSEAIITNDSAAAGKFTLQTDSAAVYVNASTRFTDGGQFGLGCEMGISTQKLHARGPMGLAELTSYKYIITGNGQVRK